jgi:hypothetical protein
MNEPTRKTWNEYGRDDTSCQKNFVLLFQRQDWFLCIVNAAPFGRGRLEGQPARLLQRGRFPIRHHHVRAIRFLDHYFTHRSKPVRIVLVIVSISRLLFFVVVLPRGRKIKQ